MISNVFFSIVQTFIVFGFGALAFRWKMIQEEDMRRMTRLTLDLFFPLLTFATITHNFDVERWNELWQLPLIGLGLMLCGGLAGLGLKRFMWHGTPERLRTFHHICAINNYVFLPLIVLQCISERYAAMVLVMNVGSTIGFWTVGIFTLTGIKSFSETLRSIFSINLVAVAAALAVAFTGLTVPAPLDAAITSVGNLSVPFMLILVGAALYQCAGKIMEHRIDLLYLTVIRLLVLPVIMALLLKLLPVSRDVYVVSLVVAAMPAASSSVLVAGQYGGSRNFAGQVIVVTTLLSLGSIPLILWLFM